MNEPVHVRYHLELMPASTQLSDCIHLHAFRWILKSSLLAELSLIALNPHSSQAKLTVVDSPSPFRLFSRNDRVLTDALAEERKRGEKIVSKEPCFINVNMVTGQNDQSPSSIHNNYSIQRKREIKSIREEGERSRQVQ